VHAYDSYISSETVSANAPDPITVPEPVSFSAERNTPTVDAMSSGLEVPAAMSVAPAMLHKVIVTVEWNHKTWTLCIEKQNNTCQLCEWVAASTRRCRQEIHHNREPSMYACVSPGRNLIFVDHAFDGDGKVPFRNNPDANNDPDNGDHVDDKSHRRLELQWIGIEWHVAIFAQMFFTRLICAQEAPAAE